MNEYPCIGDDHDSVEGGGGERGGVPEEQGGARPAPQVHFIIWRSICGILVTRFYALIKLEKVEEEEMEALLENLPDEYAAMLGEPHQQILPTSSHPHFHSPDVLVRHPGFQDDWH